MHGDGASLLESAIAAYRGVGAYRVVLRSLGADRRDALHYCYKRPGHVRIELIAPLAGAVLIYSPVSGRATLWPRGHRRFPTLDLRPDHPLIRTPSGQRIDRSDLGALYENVQAVQRHGTVALLGGDTVGGRDAAHIAVEAGADFDGAVARYELWLDAGRHLPLKVQSHARDGRMIEAIALENMQIDPEFPDHFFEP